MRDKERLHDYRFMPEPNLPPLRLYTAETMPPGVPPEQIVNVDELRDKMPEMPNAQRRRLCETYGLSVEHSNVLVVSYDQLLLLLFAAAAVTSARLIIAGAWWAVRRYELLYWAASAKKMKK